MKKLVSLFAVVLFAVQAFAQINLQDSTIQVIGYWAVGDKYNYELKSSSYKTDGKDTTWTRRSKDIFAFEVIDSTDTGYLLKCTFLESMSLIENKELDEIAGKLNKMAQKIPVVLKTDIYGTVQGLSNFDEYQSELLKAVNLITQEMKTDNDKVSAQIIESVASIMKSEDFVYKSIEPITSLLAFHGGKYSIDREYSEDHQLASPIDPAIMIDAKNVFGIYDYDTESSVTRFYDEWIYNNEQIKASALALINKMLPKGEELLELPDEQKIKLTVFKQINIHTNSGWPTFGYYINEIASQNQTKVQEWEANIIME